MISQRRKTSHKEYLVVKNSLFKYINKPLKLAYNKLICEKMSESGI